MFIRHFRNRFYDNAFTDAITFMIPRDRDAVVLQMILEGFGRPSDCIAIRDYPKDTEELLTMVNLQLLIPLL